MFVLILLNKRDRTARLVSNKKRANFLFFLLYTYKTRQILLPTLALLCSGEYWIDTNGGTKEDAFLARCNFDDYSVQTCIQPKKTSYEKVSYEKVKSGYKWILQEIHSERDKVRVLDIM